MKPGKCGTMTHDYKRNGPTNLFAALNILNGTVVGRCMLRYSHNEFVKLQNAEKRTVPARKIIHSITDNNATHKHPTVKEWLTDHPRWIFHFTPASTPWLNAVESFFSTFTRRYIRRGIFKPVSDLQDAIRSYISETTAPQSPSSGPSPPKQSSPNSTASPLHHLNEPVH